MTNIVLGTVKMQGFLIQCPGEIESCHQGKAITVQQFNKDLLDSLNMGLMVMFCSESFKLACIRSSLQGIVRNIYLFSLIMAHYFTVCSGWCHTHSDPSFSGIFLY